MLIQPGAVSACASRGRFTLPPFVCVHLRLEPDCTTLRRLDVNLLTIIGTVLGQVRLLGDNIQRCSAGTFPFCSQHSLHLCFLFIELISLGPLFRNISPHSSTPLQVRPLEDMQTTVEEVNNANYECPFPRSPSRLRVLHQTLIRIFLASRRRWLWIIMLTLWTP